MNRRAIFTSAALKLAKSSVYILLVALLGFGSGLTAAYALDGTPSPANVAPALGVGVGVAPQGAAR
jgi:hypothetical protein